MQTLSFNIDIGASREKVWDALWSNEHYPKWTSVFDEGSYAQSDWEEGSKINFLNGAGSGMSSIIAKKTPNEFMSFKHLGEIKNGEEQPLNEESKKWSGATESYTLTENGAGTKLSVELEMIEAHVPYFTEKFPQALQKVKELAEA